MKTTKASSYYGEPDCHNIGINDLTELQQNHPDAGKAAEREKLCQRTGQSGCVNPQRHLRLRMRGTKRDTKRKPGWTINNICNFNYIVTLGTIFTLVISICERV